MTQRNRRLRAWFRASAVALPLLLLAGSAAVSRSAGGRETVPVPPTPSEDAPAGTPATPAAPPSAGLRALIDPETGELTAHPSPQQLRQFALASRLGLSRSVVGLRPFALEAGGRGVHLQGRFQSALRVERADDGTFRTTCGDPGHAGEPAHRHDASPLEPRSAGGAVER